MIKVASLFSGAGFLDLGFAENGFDIVWGAEIVPEFSRAHNYNMRLRYNHDVDRIHTVDIVNVSPMDMPQNIRGIIGGPPCQDFSIGNASNPGVTGERGRLVWNFLEKIAYLQPDFFLFENVEGLYKIKKHRTQALLPMLEILEDMSKIKNSEFVNIDSNIEGLGYKTYFKVLNALEFGIPQDRARVFIIGFKNSIIETLQENYMDAFQWPTPIYPDAKTSYNWPEAWELGTEIDEAKFIKNLDVPYELTVHSAIGNQKELERLPNHVSFNPKSDKFNIVMEGDTSRKSFKRLHRFRYSPTVAYGNNEVHLHPTLPRRLTVREALRLQSVPDWYKFPDDMPLDKMFKMVSNGVPYKLAFLLAIQIKKVLTDYDSLTLKNENKQLLETK
uniref:DNA (cytosine-5-)-methyltransferase n=1 Tax=Geobacillus stearothermophilus TaxID=1422 RepID=Q8RT52_GEOSE|nr:DNA methyltransferase Bse634IM [Geobacillus stearothermophilus]